MLWQLPPHFHRDDDLLGSVLKALTPGRHPFEFRDPSWFADDVYELLRQHGAALVVADPSPGQPSPAGWSYLRFLSKRARDGNYGARELRAWATQVTSQTGDVFAYFNDGLAGLRHRQRADAPWSRQARAFAREVAFFVDRFACSSRSATSPVGSFGSPARSRSFCAISAISSGA
jgi:uncharacterized protein YecE (DUF72 family)